jgi:hypothetical protein
MVAGPVEGRERGLELSESPGVSPVRVGKETEVSFVETK